MDKVIIATNILIWPKIKNMVPDHRLIYVALWFNTQVLACGAFFIDLDMFAAYVGFSRTVVEKAINDFAELKLVIYDESSSEIFIIDWWRFHKCETRAQIKMVQRSVDKLRSDTILNEFFKSIIRVSNQINDLRSNTTQPNLTEYNLKIIQPNTTTSSKADVVDSGSSNSVGGSEDSVNFDLASKILTALRDEVKVLDTNDKNPDFIELITLGLSVQDFLDAANSVNDSSKRRFNYILKVARSRHEVKSKSSSTKNGDDDDWTKNIRIGPDGKIG